MKTAPIRLSKIEAVAIARLSLIENIMQKPGIWSHLNKRVRTGKESRKATRTNSQKHAEQTCCV
ncbi:MAG: hypothetical protein K8T89_16360 [Planctomycetes bacterium]|nr:hypothetical protein [Planctomycetota bacterium]